MAANLQGMSSRPLTSALSPLFQVLPGHRGCCPPSDASADAALHSSETVSLISYIADKQALTLLEFLVKNGSERVVDDARAHISTIKMLRSFHYIDEKGKDQGINGMFSLCAAILGLVSSSAVSASLRICGGHEGAVLGCG